MIEKKVGEVRGKLFKKIAPSSSLIPSIKVRTDKILIHLQFQQVLLSGYLILAHVLEVQGTGKSHFFSLLPESVWGKGNEEGDKTKIP